MNKPYNAIKTQLTNDEFELFRKFIAEKSGVDIGCDKAYIIESRLAKYLADFCLDSFDKLYNFIVAKDDPILTDKVIDAVTTHETCWFRDESPWKIMQDVLLPKYVSMLRDGSRDTIKIWSAACSTGQEAYSVVMCVDNYLKKNDIKDVKLSQFCVMATDISKCVLDIGKKGWYDGISIKRGLDAKYRDEYFTKINADTWQINDNIKNQVRFQQFNLQNNFLAHKNYDIILLRYVMFYFTQQFRAELAAKTARAINDKSAIFIGSSELYPEFFDFYELVRYENGTYYTLK